MGIAAPIVLQQNLETSSQLIPFVARDESAVYGQNATEILRITLETRPGGLQLVADLTEAASQRNRAVLASQNPSSLIAELNGLGKQIDSRAALFSTQNEQALKSFALAVASPVVSQRIEYLNQSVVLDPNFAVAYIALIETLAESGNPDLAAVLKNAEARRAGFSPLDQARFDLARARLAQAPPGSLAKAAEDLLRLAPNNTDALAALAVRSFQQGNGAEGARLLTRALAINPNDTTLRRQLASGLIQTRNFAEAEKVFAGFGNDPSVQPSLAACLLLAGKPADADTVYNRFLSSIPNPDARVLLAATWRALSGRVPQGITELANVKWTDARLATLASNQIALWRTMLGTAVPAASANTQPTAPAAPFSYATMFASKPSSAIAWRARVDALPPNAGNELARQTLNAYGLFLYGFYSEAAEAWQLLDQRSWGTDGRARVMLAASLDRADRKPEAARIHIQPFVPDLSDFYAAISFNELRRLLGQTG